MTFIKEILVPTDFSSASKRALRYACELADAFGASLHVLHVAENPYVPGGYMEYYPPPQEFIESMAREARRQLDAVLTPEEKAKYRTELAYRTGLPAQEVLAYLRERPTIDLVIMATHGRGAVARLMLGSVADKVVRAAPCPVLTLREAEKAGEDVKSAA